MKSGWNLGRGGWNQGEGRGGEEGGGKGGGISNADPQKCIPLYHFK